MALTRKLLKSMGLSEEQIDAIIDAHADTVDGLKGRIRALEGVPGAGEPEDWRVKHDELKKLFDDYKAEIADREATAKLRTAYRALLKAENVDEKRHDAILRVTDLSKLKLDEDGTLKDAEALRASIQSDWGAFVVTRNRRGASVPTPPGSAPARKTREEILAIRDAGARQRAMAENHELFGF